MSPQRSRVPDKIASGARKFLKVFFIFLVGFLVAHTETVQRIEKAAGTGELADSLLSNNRDTYDRKITVWSNSAVPHALSGGAVLIGPEFSRSPALLLMGEDGHMLHRWTIDTGLFNPAIKDWWKDINTNAESAIDDARLLPNGDVIFIQTLMSENNYRGQRLARMDKDSHILWQVPGDFHHFIDIPAGQEKIYAINSRLREGYPEIAAPQQYIRYMDDYIESYTLDGKKLDEWSIAEAFENSPYRTWLSSFEITLPIVQRIEQSDGRVLYDLFHINSVQYLDAAKAKALPQAKEGDLLISFRTLNAIAVLRPATKQIVWVAKGPWRHQHCATVLGDGKLYIYDNEGREAVTLYRQYGPPEQIISRVVRFDPFTGELKEIYAAPDLYSYFKGNYQQLADGSWIISSPLHGKVVVVSPEHGVVWEMRTVSNRAQEYIPHRKQISFMHYYPASMLKFLHPDS